MLCLMGTFILGYHEGFDTTLTIMAFGFGLLLFADLVSAVLAKPEKVLKSVWLNLFIVGIRLTYLVFASLLFYGLFWAGGLDKYYRVYFVAAVLLTIINLPWMTFHLALCVPKWRRRMAEFDAKTRCIFSE